MNGLDRWSQYNYFWDVISPSLRPTARLVWLAVFRHADTLGRSCVTRSRLAAMINATKKSVSDGIKELKDNGLIEKIDGEYGYVISLNSNRTVSTSNPTVTPPVTPRLHNTEPSYRTDIQNLLTEHTTYENDFSLSDSPPIQKQPKQAKLPKTSKSDWKAKASSTFLFQAFNMYPTERRLIWDPKLLQPAWDEAAEEEGGYDVLWNMVRVHLEKAVLSEQWTKKGGEYIPGMEKYLRMRKYREPLKAKETYDDGEGIDY